MLRHAVVDAARHLVRHGLNEGTTGNVSVRCGDGFLITPSGVPAEALRPAEVVRMDLDGSWSGDMKPSSEWRIHRDILVSRPDVNAIVHAHAPFCTTLAVLRMGIPAFHYMVAAAGGRDIRCAGYATFGTQELSDLAMAALDGRRACLLANHGMIATGANLPLALALAVEVESLAEQYWRALQIGQPVILPDAEMDMVIDKFKGYGQNAQNG